MIYDYHVVLGLLAIFAGLVGQALYIKDLLRGTIKPHPFSWLGWASLDATVFLAQIVKGGGAGSWVLGVAAFVNTVIALISLKRGEKHITWSDWACFLSALLGIILWVVTKNPLFAVILASVINCVAFVPTFRKAYVRPTEESVNIFVFDAIKFFLSIAALGAVSATTVLFPVVAATSNIVFVLMVLLRRRQLARIPQS